jgi:multidrug transporter EmrE-like cation transporter
MTGQPLVLDMFFRPGFVVAVGCLGISFFIYVKVLATLPLAVAYPVMVGVSLLIVAAVGYFWFGIDLSPGQLAGIGIVFAGVTLISRSSRTSVQERVIE